MENPTLLVLFIVVLALWLLGLKFPKIKRWRVSVIVSFVLLCAATGLRAVMVTSHFALILGTLIIWPSFWITLPIYRFLNLFGIATDFFGGGNDSFWVCVLVFSFVINAFVIFWVIRIASYIWKKCFMSRANVS